MEVDIGGGESAADTAVESTVRAGFGRQRNGLQRRVRGRGRLVGCPRSAAAPPRLVCPREYGYGGYRYEEGPPALGLGSLVPGGENSEMAENDEHFNSANSRVGAAGLRWAISNPAGRVRTLVWVGVVAGILFAVAPTFFRGFVAGTSPLTAPAGVMPTPPAHERW